MNASVQPLTPTPTPATAVLPRRVAVVGAAGGLGQGILGVCRAEGIDFTAIVRSRPDRITSVPEGSRVLVVPTLADRDGLTAAFSGADAVLLALGVTRTSCDRSALLSANMATVEDAMRVAGVDRIVIVNSIAARSPGQGASRILRLFSWLPGIVGRGAAELLAVVDELGKGALSSLRWTLVRAAVNSRGKDLPPAACPERSAINSWLPLSYAAMGRWMLEEAAANRFVRAAPVVSRRRT